MSYLIPIWLPEISHRVVCLLSVALGEVPHTLRKNIKTGLGQDLYAFDRMPKMATAFGTAYPGAPPKGIMLKQQELTGGPQFERHPAVINQGQAFFCLVELSA